MGFLKHLVFADLGGKYSVARLEALHKFCVTTRTWWCFLVIVTAPFVSVVVAASLNWIPLKSPTEGVKANWAFFVREFFLTLIVMIAIGMQRRFHLSARIPLLRSILLRVTFSLISALCMYLASEYIAFPMPFCCVVVCAAMAPLALILVPLALFSHHREQRPSDPVTQDHWSSDKKRTTKVLAFNFTLLMMYAFLQVGYAKLADHQTIQLVYVCCLPVVKFVNTYVAKKLCHDVGDFAVEGAVFSAVFVSVIFSSVFLGMGSSWINTLVIIAVDLLQLAVPLVRLAKNAKMVMKFSKQLNSTVSPNGVKLNLMEQVVELVHKHPQLVDSDQRIANRPDFYERQALIAKWCLRDRPHDSKQTKSEWFSNARRVMPVVAEGASSAVKASPVTVTTSVDHVIDTRTTQPRMDGAVTKSASAPASNKADTEDLRLRLFDCTLTMLYALEHLVLVEFVESFTPFSYALYVYLTSHSPSRAFFIGISDLDDQALAHAMTVIMMYGMLEFLTLVVLCMVVYRHMKINLLVHLAFVLETHFTNIQGKILLFLACLMDVRLVHNGADFSFQFEWLRHQRASSL